MAKPTHLASLDSIRAFCILLVLGSHATAGAGFPAAWKRTGLYLFNGSVGVLIFFVLSGFLISWLLAQEEERTGTISLRSFYARRFLRILPVYFAFLFALACLQILTHLHVSWCQYLTAITFTKNYGCGSWIDGHLWSLSVEEQFYLMWPFVLTFAPKRFRLYVAAILVCLAPAFRVWFYVNNYTELRLFSFMTNMDSLMIGSMTGLAVRRNPEAVKAFFAWNSWLCRLVAVGAIYAVWLLQLHLALGRVLVPLGTTIQSAAAAYLIASYTIHQHGVIYRILNLPPICHLGVLSYSIYIWQQPFFSTPEEFGMQSVSILTFPFNVISAIAVGALSYHTFEKPLLNLRKRFRRVDFTPRGQE